MIAAGLLAAPRFETSHRGDGMIEGAIRHAGGLTGALAVIVIEDGQVAGSHFQSSGEPVNGDTRFQMASVSKWVTAWVVLKLVEQGRLGLDEPVAPHLRRWQLQGSAGDLAAVTPRRLLSHTAGLTDRLGYCGFASPSEVQPLEMSLERASDACPGLAGRVGIGAAPGSIWRYSGGGYGILQLLVEEVTGEPFAEVAAREILIPLGMTRSTFDSQQASTGLAPSFDAAGQRSPVRYYSNAAAAGFTSTADDMALFALAHLPGPDGEAPGRGILGSESLALMTASQARMLAVPVWGLGVSLYVQRAGHGLVIGHDGGNRPAINTSVRVDLAGRDAIIALATGSPSLASEIGGAWTAPRSTGINPLRVYGAAVRMFPWIAAGVLVILAVGGFQIWRLTRRPLFEAD